MIDENIKINLATLHGNLNFIGLLEFMEQSGIPFKSRKLKGPLGLASFDGIYLDLNQIGCYPSSLLFFIILHEMAHYKRITKFGKSKIVSLLSETDFELFVDHVVGEEIIADRYGCLMYRYFNGKTFPREATQNLHLPYKREKYKTVASLLYGKIQNDENKYDALLASFIA